MHAIPRIRILLLHGARAFRDTRESLRDHAAVHRGLWIAAPCLWSAFTVFLHPAWGAIGFACHALAVLPRRRTGAFLLLAAYPLLTLAAAARAPHHGLPGMPFHVPFSPDTVSVAREGVALPPYSQNARGHVYHFRADDGMRFRILHETTDPPAAGTRVRVLGRAEAPAPPPNPGQLDMRRVLRAQGAAAMLQADSVAILRPPPRWRRGLAAARARLAASLERNVPPASRHLLEAALLNDTRNIPPATADAFLRAGMRHILAISGLHVGLLAVFLTSLCLFLRLPRKLAFTLAGGLAAAYVPLVESPVSAVRAGLMLGLMLPAILLERRPSALHALNLALAIDLLAAPHHVAHLGFQLSYAATLALILVSGPIAAATHGRRFAAVRQTILLGAAVSAFTHAPLAANVHAATPWSPLGNLVAMPPGTAMLLCGMFTWLLDALTPAWGDGPARLAGAAAGASALALETAVAWLARLPGSLLAVPMPPPEWLATWCAAVACGVALLRAGRAQAALLVLVLLAAAEWTRPVLSRAAGGTRVTTLAVGHGDAILVEARGAVLLVDAGDSPRAARNVILPALRRHGINRIDALLLTHADLDHFGGAAAVLAALPVGRILAPREPDDAGAGWNCLRRYARARGVRWDTVAAGDRLLATRRDTLWALGPDAGLHGAGKNDRSLVALWRAPGGSALLTGDIEAAGQRALASTWPLWRGAWLKLPHHGSDRTTLSCFLHAAEPPRAVASCGGRRGFPGARTLGILEDGGVDAAVTARHGAVTWTFGRRGAREDRHLHPN